MRKLLSEARRFQLFRAKESDMSASDTTLAPKPELCGHGLRMFSPVQPCLECDRVWHEEMLRVALARAAFHETKLREIARKVDLPNIPKTP